MKYKHATLEAMVRLMKEKAILYGSLQMTNQSPSLTEATKKEMLELEAEILGRISK